MPAMTRARGWASSLAVYLEYRSIIMLLLGFSSGLPFLLVFSTLSAWLREAGISRTDIGLMSYVGLAYTIKFLWAPVLDHLHLPVLNRLLGKRRAWMLLAQLVAAGALVGLSLSDPAHALMPVVICALVLAFASATQDISIDAWRIEAASDEKQGALAALYQLGYRIALIASGAGALYLAEGVSWSSAYLAMAALMGVGILAALFAPRVAEAEAPAVGEEALESFARRHHIEGRAQRIVTFLYRAVVAPFVDFFQRYGWWALVLLALIGLYRVPDFVMGVMANPLYIDLGFELSTIATVGEALRHLDDHWRRSCRGHRLRALRCAALAAPRCHRRHWHKPDLRLARLSGGGSGRARRHHLHREFFGRLRGHLPHRLYVEPREP
ncbi:MFS transporter [Parvibaculum sp.]|uniref:MFS transporter n=1 Tax=Parvibaculum sp. TaxID=2024848 RepID=UPI003BAD51D0